MSATAEVTEEGDMLVLRLVAEGTHSASATAEVTEDGDMLVLRQVKLMKCAVLATAEGSEGEMLVLRQVKSMERGSLPPRGRWVTGDLARSLLATPGTSTLPPLLAAVSC